MKPGVLRKSCAAVRIARRRSSRLLESHTTLSIDYRPPIASACSSAVKPALIAASAYVSIMFDRSTPCIYARCYARLRGKSDCCYNCSISSLMPRIFCTKEQFGRSFRLTIILSQRPSSINLRALGQSLAHVLRAVLVAQSRPIPKKSAWARDSSA